ncbi:MAG: hypothetical protein JW863_08020 [Chitinispirillaceae bacterium]|nr:hypothetical protein [Chitinispirillaceae bacterium]
MRWSYILLLSVFFSSGLLAQDTSASEHRNAPRIKLSGHGYYMFGQIVSGVYGDVWASPPTTFAHLWLSTCLVHLQAKSDPTDWFTVKLGFELYIDYFKNGSGAMPKSLFLRNYKAYLPAVEGIMHWNFEHSIVSSLKIESGLFPYTFNSQVKTLGNYLFRSTIHPLSVQNKFDYPWADLMGGLLEIGLFENRLSVEAILASEFNYVPFFDFTPAFGLYFKPNEVIDVGGAIAFHHALQANVGLMPDSIGEKWQGIKINARAIFDPKPLFGGMDFIEKEGLKNLC